MADEGESTLVELRRSLERLSEAFGDETVNLTIDMCAGAVCDTELVMTVDGARLLLRASTLQVRVHHCASAAA